MKKLISDTLKLQIDREVHWAEGKGREEKVGQRQYLGITY